MSFLNTISPNFRANINIENIKKRKSQMKINAKVKSRIQREILKVVNKIINNQSEGNKYNEM